MTQAEHVNARLNFAVNTGELFLLYPSVGGGPAEELTGEHELKHVRIENGRSSPGSFSLDQQGFTFLEYPSATQDLYHPGQQYDAEIEALIKRLTGVREVLVFDHTLRADDEKVRDQRKTRQPAYMVHNDYTEQSGPRRLRDLLPKAEAEEKLKRRFVIINVWRSIAGPVQSSPMAICDGRSIAAEDLVLTERRAKERTGYIYQLSFNEKQRWYFFPKMQPDEVLVFKCFDSAPGGAPPFAAHTAFEDPNSPPNAPARESIETRTIAFF